MSALPPTPSGVIRFRLIHEQPNADHVGSHHDLAYTGSAPTTTDLTVLAGFATAAWATHLEPFLSNAALLQEIVAIDLANPGTPEGITAVTAGGTRTGNALPNNIAAVMIGDINRRYRGSRPKCFLPFFTESDQSSTTTWLTGSVTALNGAWASYLAELLGQSAGGTTLGASVAVSYYSGKHPNPNPNGRLAFLPTPRAVPAIFDILSWACATRFGSQRRRLTSS